MDGAVKQAYREVLKLIKRLPPPARGYYTQYARENFITYSEAQDAASIRALLARAHNHTCWILKKVIQPLTILTVQCEHLHSGISMSGIDFLRIPCALL